MYINNQRGYYELGTENAQPEIRYGTARPDGDAVPWSAMSVGSLYFRTATGNVETYQKRKADTADNDWQLIEGSLIETVVLADVTDGGSTVGTYTMTGTVPVGVILEGSDYFDITAWAGDTSCTLTVGDGSDVDRCNTGTPSVFATLAALGGGVASGTAGVATAFRPVLTFTSGADWGSVSGGSVTVVVRYRGVA